MDPCARDSKETPFPALRWVDPARTVAFFGLLYAVLWLGVQPALIADCGTITNFPVFYRGGSFFWQSVQLPGGFVHYVSAFASQLFHYSWAGAAVITLHAWAVCACTGYLLRKAGLPGARVLRFVPAILMLIAYARYSYHLPLFMGALASAAFASLYAKLTGRSRSDVGIYLDLSLLLYLVGAAALLPFAALCAAVELRRARWRESGLCLLVGLAVPYLVGVLIFRVSLVNAYTELLPVSWRVLGWATREKMVATVYGVYLFPILGVLAAAIWQVLTGRHPASRKPRAGFLARSLAQPAVAWAFGTLGLFAVGGAAAALVPDAGQKALLQVHHYACRRMWPEVLAVARRCPGSDYAGNAIDRALYHSGQLGSDLFLYAQRPEALVITGDDHLVLHWHAFDTLMDLGLMNLAEKNLTECLETFGEQPLILERLATVNLIKGRTEAARIYLGVLQKTLFHHRWASERLMRLEVDPSLAGDSEIQRLRVRYFRPDSPAEFYDREAMLTALVVPGEGVGPQPQGSGNRMAFEYLMAWHLLKGNLGKVAQQVERLGEFGYTRIPPLWQEAILIYAYGAGKPDALDGLAIDPELDRRFKNFSSIAKSYGGNMAAAIPALAKDYRGSYFFYFFCTKVAKR